MHLYNSTFIDENLNQASAANFTFPSELESDSPSNNENNILKASHLLANKSANSLGIAWRAMKGAYLESEFNESVKPIEVRFEQVLRDEPIMTDLSIALLLMSMAFVCVSYLGICFLYHKYRVWKNEVLATQNLMMTTQFDVSQFNNEESLPRYTIVSGLPSYEQAVQFMKQAAAESSKTENLSTVQEETPPPVISFARLSLGEIFHFYKIEKPFN